MTDEMVSTKHPLGKRNQPVARRDYETFETAILTALRRAELTHTELLNELTNSLKGKFSGNVGWHLMVVKLDLEARKLIKRTASSPQRYRLTRP
jgi:hypothetical protein